MKPYSIFFLQRNGTYFLNKPRTYVQLPNRIRTRDLRVREMENKKRITPRDECDEADLNLRILSKQNRNFVPCVGNYKLLAVTLSQNKRLCYSLV